MPPTYPDLVLPSAVLWDMDGTLIDTEPYWMAAETELVEAHGGVWTHQDGLALVGNPMMVSASVLRDRGVDLPLEEIVDFLNRQVAAAVAAELPWQAGAQQVLADLRDAGVPMALVTSSFRILAEPFAEAAGLFDVVVTGDGVTRAKPDPEPYQLAAQLLGVDIEDCVAIEDSGAGITSALASGARAVAIEVMQPVAARPGLSRIAALSDLTLPTFARIVRGEVLDLRRAG
ncbi:HAD family hydrolase [Cellulomonas fengjieae]|uniref:HAD family hydrolase n=1 Tax=Cellulomonas fengjieae TaxID=2819978 RepID=UPI001FB9EE16|nr:HAD family phosphatase [Cellulomonas fengjieae]